MKSAPRFVHMIQASKRPQREIESKRSKWSRSCCKTGPLSTTLTLFLNPFFCKTIYIVSIFIITFTVGSFFLKKKKIFIEYRDLETDTKVFLFYTNFSIFLTLFLFFPPFVSNHYCFR